MKMFILLFLSASVTALACRSVEPFNTEDEVKADSVFIGRVTEYQLVNPEKALVSFEVIRKIKGQEFRSDKIVLESNINTKVPRNLDHFKRCYGLTTEVGMKDNKVMSGPCHPPYLLPLPSKKQDPFCANSK